MRSYMVLVIVLDFAVDVLLLLGVRKACGTDTPVYRLFVAALLGAAYSSFCLLCQLRVFDTFYCYLLVLLSMTVIAFGIRLSTLYCIAAFVFLKTALNGVSSLLSGVDVPGAVMVILGFVAIFVWMFYRLINPMLLIPVELTYGQQKKTVTALRDTGNTLKDPVTGEPVLVISAELAEYFTGLTQKQLKDPIGSMPAFPGLRLIPYKTVGSDSGMLLAVRFPEVKIGLRKGSALVAFASEQLDREGKYQALTGGNIL